MEEGKEGVADEPPSHGPSISLDPVDWFIRLAFLQAELIYTSMTSILSPVFTLYAVASESYRRAEEVRENVGSAVQKVPSVVAHSSILLVRRMGFGILAAAYVCMVLSVLMAVSVVVGVGLVKMLVEEPVFLKEKLHFDYTEIYPKAVLSFRGSSAPGFASKGSSFIRRKHTGIPTGHTFIVSLMLEMPESDFNRRVGIFQLTAELLSTDGRVIAGSSHPFMLRYRSLPIRVARTLLLGLPLLLGVSVETQKIKIEVLRHREGYPRSEAIRFGLIPRAGAVSLPQVLGPSTGGSTK
ncbi:hypothetical protein MLD38_039748 [Melastoma candidum]|uniref:Uncharacterized protein n=1 Tax=Melastoma candidum TaxID=119954 RepID=A0ACB9L3S5_9MYRT|nr:hypothetical protein MLD38_039748 [Melastoma candidum]